MIIYCDDVNYLSVCIQIIKFHLLATKVGNTIKTVGTYWILDSIQWQGYWGTARHSTWPRSPYRGLLPIPCNTKPDPFLTEQFQTRQPRSWCTYNCPHSRNKKGPLDRSKSCSLVGATYEALLHLPCFSHSRLMRLEATITFIGHISQNAHRPPDDVLKAFNPYKFVPGSNETEGTISLHSFWNHPQSQRPQPLHSKSPSRIYKHYSVKLITESATELYRRIALTPRVFTCSTSINDLTFNWN